MTTGAPPASVTARRYPTPRTNSSLPTSACGISSPGPGRRTSDVVRPMSGRRMAIRDILPVASPLWLNRRKTADFQDFSLEVDLAWLREGRPRRDGLGAEPPGGRLDPHRR